MKVPTDIVEKIKRLAKQKEIPVADLQKRYNEILKTNATCASIEDPEEKMRVGWGALMSEQISVGRGQDYILRLISKLVIRKVGNPLKRVSDIYAIVKPVDEDGEIGDEAYASVTLWEDATDNLEIIKPGKMYKVNLAETRNKPLWGLSLSSNECTFVKTDEAEISTLQDFYENEIKPLDGAKINTGNADIRVSKDSTDLRILYASIMGLRNEKDSNGREYAVYDVFDGMKDDRFSVWIPLDEMKYGPGSDCLFIGEVRQNKKGITNMSAHFVLPAAPHSTVPLRLEPKPPTGGQQEANLPDDTGDTERDESKEQHDENEMDINFD